LTTRPEIYDK
jgi:opine dehydrogenase